MRNGKSSSRNWKPSLLQEQRSWCQSYLSVIWQLSISRIGTSFVLEGLLQMILIEWLPRLGEVFRRLAVISILSIWAHVRPSMNSKSAGNDIISSRDVLLQRHVL